VEFDQLLRKRHQHQNTLHQSNTPFRIRFHTSTGRQRIILTRISHTSATGTTTHSQL